MPSLPPPKAVLFDIGGVVVGKPIPAPSPLPLPFRSTTHTSQVISPFQAILDYEIENNIPVGWVNFAIQKGPHDTGAWQLIERGECVLDDVWFEDFRKQLSMKEHWEEFCMREAKKGVKGVGNGTRGSVPPVPNVEAKKMFWRMMRCVAFSSHEKRVQAKCANWVD
jgi:hypothetical protein